jgi:hypothetical protein
MMSRFIGRPLLSGSLATRRWCGIVLVTLEFALSIGMPAVAQEAAKPDGAAGAGPLAWILFLLPPLIIMFFLIPLMRRQKKYSTQVNRSLEISEETLQLDREHVALQKQTNELLRQLIEKQSRF